MKTVQKPNENGVAIDGSQDPATIGFCSCQKCQVRKSENDFYTKENGRKDKTCIECRKSRRNKLYKLQKSMSLETPINLSKVIEQVSPESNLAEKPTETVGITGASISHEDILEIAEAFLLLEKWQSDLDTQGDLSNSNPISNKKSS